MDAIGIVNTSDLVSLSVIDSWTWDDESAHLAALTDKINCYLGFIESGEVYEAYPLAKGKGFEICVYGRFMPSPLGLRLIDHASEVAGTYDVKLRFEHHPGQPEPEPEPGDGISD